MAFLKALYHIGKAITEANPNGLLAKVFPKVKSFDDFADGKQEAIRKNKEYAEKHPHLYDRAKVVVLSIHGINVTDEGAGTTAKFSNIFTKNGAFFEIVGYRWVAIPDKTNKRIGKYLAERIAYHKTNGKTVVVIGHSNGCAIMDYASQIGAMPADIYCYLNPAVEKDREPQGVKWTLVWHTEDDHVVWWSRLLSLVTFNSVKARPWGEMGKTGYKGKHKNVINFEYSNKNLFNPAGSGHSGIFQKFDHFEKLVFQAVMQATEETDINSFSLQPVFNNAISRIKNAVYDHSIKRVA